jgi:SAM-dependent methyltransferase
MKRYDSICNICGASDFQPFANRSDGVAVIRCGACGHGVVEHFVEDVRSLYRDEYFTAPESSGTGYADYKSVAEQGVAWVAPLVKLLRPDGRILDIGCANGAALLPLDYGYERFGIEMNVHMAEEAARAGIQVIGHDLLEPGVQERHAREFDIVTAIAVFEHIPDFKGAVEAALHLLKPEGVLVFEVPLIRSETDIWFRSSLEHIHYPTEPSLRRLFEDILGLHLTASAVEVPAWGHIFVGLASRSRDAAQRAGERFHRALTAPPASLTQVEGRFRGLFDLMHAARVTPELLAAFPEFVPDGLSRQLVRRTFSLWAAREQWWAARQQAREQTWGQTLAARGQMLAAREHEIDGLRQRICDLENSLSWRISKPLRTLAGLLRRRTT